AARGTASLVRYPRRRPRRDRGRGRPYRPLQTTQPLHILRQRRRSAVLPRASGLQQLLVRAEALLALFGGGVIQDGLVDDLLGYLIARRDCGDGLALPRTGRHLGGDLGGQAGRVG